MSRGRTSSYVDPDRAYMRSRGNRRVRKVRLARSSVKWGAILVFHASLIAAITFCVVRVVERVGASPEFALERVVLVGCERVPQERLHAELRAFLGRNLLELDLEAIASRLEADPWVARASVRRVLPCALRVEIDERRPIAIAVLADGEYVVDAGGTLIAPASDDDRGGLPELRGIGRGEHAELRDRLRRGAEIVTTLGQRHPGLVASVDLSHRDRLEVVTREPGPRLYLDPSEVERNVEHYLILRDAIRDRVGSAEYIDLRWRDRITVRPRVES